MPRSDVRSLFSVALGQELRGRRRELGLRQSDMARVANTTTYLVQRLERGYWPLGSALVEDFVATYAAAGGWSWIELWYAALARLPQLNRIERLRPFAKARGVRLDLITAAVPERVEALRAGV